MQADGRRGTTMEDVASAEANRDLENQLPPSNSSLVA